MSTHLHRARVLLAQSRPADAHRELLPALASAPNNPEVHATLALCHLRLDRPTEAIEPATTAIGLAPDWDFPHHVHAIALRDLSKYKDALAAIAEAIRLNPDDADHFALQSSIHLARDDWASALASADEALRLDPENNDAANLRAMALVRLGRKDEAVLTVDRNLARNPNDAFSHANQGWNALHRNDPHRAQEHFREALRLDPSFDYARSGLLEALKARNPVYRGMLAYFLWMGRMSQKIQWAFIIGVVFVNRFVQNLTAARPDLVWVLVPLQVAFYGFIYLSWTAVPLFNFTLLFDRFGRHVLTRRERIGALIFGPSFLLLVTSLVWWIAGAERGLLATKVVAYISAFVATTVLATGVRAWIFGAATGLLALIGLGGLALVLAGYPQGLGLVVIFLLSSVIFMLLALFIREK